VDIKNVTVCGSGVLGNQIAFQVAFHGFNVTVYDISDEVLAKAKTRRAGLAESYQKELKASKGQIDATVLRISDTSDIAEASRAADLVIEAIPEDVQIKLDFYRKLGQLAPATTIFATNSSTFLPSKFAEATGRPDQFLALHFANHIWMHNTAEIMGHPGTRPDVFATVVEFARSIGMVALPIKKEQPGYILNSLLVPFQLAALQLWIGEVASYETIDKTWMIATDSRLGPFGRMDIIGIATVYNIVKAEADRREDPSILRIASALKEQFLDKGKLGLAAGEGFYQYPAPAFQHPGFLS
jgi:3-hydroxyacyl-CoA dehydrogenase